MLSGLPALACHNTKGPYENAGFRLLVPIQTNMSQIESQNSQASVKHGYANAFSQAPVPAGAFQGPRRDAVELRRSVAEFQTPALAPSLWQLINSFGGFFVSCAAMYLSYDFSYWLTLALAPLAAGFLVRIFIIQHDCGHRAFFRSRRANDIAGFACSILTFTPYAAWRRQHAGHHGIWNDLDRRQSGADIYSSCLTLSEYEALPRMSRWWYRVTRHPFVANLLLPPFVFTLLYRFPFDMPESWRRERRMVQVTNLAIVLVFGGAGFLLGFEKLAAVQLPVLIIASIIGVGLFAVQHRGERVIWARRKDWDPVVAALHSTTFLRLPRFLQWFTGNIGFHHVHHLNARVPNYRLEECHNRVEAVREAPQLSFFDGLRTLRYVLWDEMRQRMITFNGVARAR